MKTYGISKVCKRIAHAGTQRGHSSNDRRGNQGCHQPVFQSRRSLFLPHKSHDVIHHGGSSFGHDENNLSSMRHGPLVPPMWTIPFVSFLLRQPGCQVADLARGFAPPPHDEFAVSGRSSRLRSLQRLCLYYRQTEAQTCSPPSALTCFFIWGCPHRAIGSGLPKFTH